MENLNKYISRNINYIKTSFKESLLNDLDDLINKADEDVDYSINSLASKYDVKYVVVNSIKVLNEHINKQYAKKLQTKYKGNFKIYKSIPGADYKSSLSTKYVDIIVRYIMGLDIIDEFDKNAAKNQNKYSKDFLMDPERHAPKLTQYIYNLFNDEILMIIDKDFIYIQPKYGFDSMKIYITKKYK